MLLVKKLVCMVMAGLRREKCLDNIKLLDNIIRGIVQYTCILPRITYLKLQVYHVVFFTDKAQCKLSIK